MCLCLGSSSLICFDLCFRVLNWYSSITFTAALLSGSMCASMSPILIRTVSSVLPHLSFFARCKTCRAVCWRYSQSDSLLASLSASVVFLTFSFRDSSLVSCLILIYSTLHNDYIYHTSGTAVLKLGSCVQGDEVPFSHSIGSISWSFFLVSCVLACGFLSVGVSCSVILGISCASSSISLRFFPLLFHLGHFVIFFHVFYLLVNVFFLAGFFEELVKCPRLLYAFLDKVVILDSLYQLFEDPVVGLVAEFTIFRLLT